MGKLDGKVVIVTGASRGIGATIADAPRGTVTGSDSMRLITSPPALASSPLLSRWSCGCIR